MIQKLTGWGALALLGIAILWLAFSPYWTLSVLKSAIEDRDAEAINVHIDYPSLRDSLKSGLRVNMEAELARQKALTGNTPGAPELFGGNMSEMAMAFGNGMIDKLVRPESVENLVERAKSQSQPAEPTGSSKSEDAAAEGDYSVDRTGLTSFEISDGKNNAALLFNLDEFTWKITGVRMPKPPEQAQ